MFVIALLGNVLNKSSRQFFPRSLQFKHSRQTKSRKNNMVTPVLDGVSTCPFYFEDLHFFCTFSVQSSVFSLM